MIRYVMSNYSPLGERRLFAIRTLSNGQPCIIGNAKEHMEQTDTSFVVAYDPEGERTTAHLLPEAGKCLYEIHVGDYISAFDVDIQEEALFVNSYVITRITDCFAVGLHAVI